MHTSAARSGEDNQREPVRRSALDGLSDHFAHDGAHASPDIAEVHHGQNGWIAFDAAATHDHGLDEARLGTHTGELLAIALRAADEVQRVGGLEWRGEVLKRTLVGNQLDAAVCGQAKVVATTLADVEILLQIAQQEQLLAAWALGGKRSIACL